MKKILLTAILAPSFLLATGASAPKGWWRCSFQGAEWQMVPGPQGSQHYQLMPRTYSSDWNKTRSVSYDEALDSCRNWSDSSCSFNSCIQKNKQ